MALAGGGAVAIWHDIAPEGRAEFYAWHGREHMPERLAIPGFRRGRRYIAVNGAPEFFNLYETATTQTVKGPDYLARLNAPTPWTIATVRHFRAVARSLCEVVTTSGRGEGGLIATFRYAVDDTMAHRHRARMATVVEGLADRPGIAGAHFLVADIAASAVETAERRARPERNVVPGWIVLVEGWDDQAAFIEWAQRFARDAAFGDASAGPDLAVYRLQNSRDRLSEAWQSKLLPGDEAPVA
ncbi:MAG TPA: hypothetical protein VMV45_00590 [Casimicrobiaceae bacterium]|nr:hypothetical protein [Casimicrobiaceae bacterium]